MVCATGSGLGTVAVMFNNLVALLLVYVKAPATVRAHHMYSYMDMRLRFKTDDGTLPLVPPIPRRAPPTTYNYSLPYSIFYNDANNCAADRSEALSYCYSGHTSDTVLTSPAVVPSVFNPGHAEQYGFIVDDFHWPRHNGTASFSIEGDPAWPNFLYGLTNDTYDPWDGIGNVSWTPKCDKIMNAGRRDGPLGPLCCRCVCVETLLQCSTVVR